MLSLPRLSALGAALALAAALAAPAAHAAALPLQHDQTTLADAPNDGVIAPGDTLTIREALENTGPSTAAGLQATLSSQTVGVTVSQGSSNYPDIAAGATEENATPFTVSVSPTLACGTPINLTLTVTSGADSASVPLSIATGVTGPLTSYAGVPLVIGDATSTIRPRLAGLSTAGTASVDAGGLVRAVEVNIGDLQHPDTSHVGLSLKSPTGTIVPLLNSGLGGPGGTFVNTELQAAGSSLSTGSSPFTGLFRADGDLTLFNGLSQQGSWRLLASSSVPSEVGRVNGWTLKVAAANCAARSVPRLVVPAGPILPGASVDLDASTSNSVNGPITSYQWDLGDGSGFSAPGASPVLSTSFARGVHTVHVRVSDAGGVIGDASATLIVTTPPVAHITLPVTPPKQNHNVMLDGSGSTDHPEDAGIARYDWDVDGDGEFDDATGVSPSPYFGEPGAHQIGLRVTDVDGATATTTATLNIVATTPPLAAISATPTHVGVGEPVVFDASGSSDDGSVVHYEWDLDGNSTFETDTDGTATAARSYPQGAAVTVSVRVTDNDDRTAIASMQLIVDAPPPPAGGGGAGSDPGAGGGAAGGATGGGGSGGGSGSGNAGGQAATGKLGASLGAAAIQGLRIVGTKGLGLHCTTDRAATCSVTATLQAADARRAGLSKSKKKAYVLGRASVRLKKAGNATVSVRVSNRVMKRLQKIGRLVVIVNGSAVDSNGARVNLRRAVLLRR
jgi:YD repeat-containing protein